MFNFLIFLLFSSFAFAGNFVNSAVVPGGVIKKEFYSFDRPKAFHKNRELLVINGKRKNEYLILAGVPLQAKAGEKFPIVVENRNSITEFNPTIENKEYKKQYIKLKSNKHVSLSQKNLDRHFAEKRRSLRVLRSYTYKKFDSLKMIKPVNKAFSGSFGKRRYFNNQPRKPHSGSDLAAVVGTPIKAPLSGKVMIVDEFFFSGNVIYIDHGLGLVTMYAHLDKFSVQEGEMVQKGEIIGKVGKTGRVTGAHLHWGVSLNGVMVDPRLFFEKTSK